MTNDPCGLSSEVSADVLDRRRLACLIGLDRAFAYVNPAFGGPGQRLAEPLVELRLRLEATGRLDTGTGDGALLTRVVRRGPLADGITSTRELFTSVVWVPAASWGRCELVRAGEGPAVLRHELAAGLRVGCVPVIADPAELRFQHAAVAGARRYTIAPADRAATLARIPRIVAALDRAGVQLALAPEGTLSPALLEAWVAALRSPDRGASNLRMLLAGSGPGLARASNTAVLLDGRTGAVIARQGKMFPFNFTARGLERWHLQSRLGTEPIAEDLVHGRALSVIEAGAMRIAILICEDLARPLDVGPIVRDLGVSHLLVPVLSRPLRPRRWEQTAAAVYVRESGAHVIVANSLVLSRITGVIAGTAMVLAPARDEALIAACEDPEQIACFTLLADGDAQVG